MEVIKLIGVLIVIIGFILKLDTLAVVVVAGLATGLVAGMSPMQILDTLGTAFITNRTATLFILTLPVIGICERCGLKDKAVDFITSLKNATTGRLIAIWQLIRTIASAFSLRIGGHPQFIRPLINPMAQAAAVVQYGELDEKTEDEIKGMCAGSENYGNFFAQNCFIRYAFDRFYLKRTGIPGRCTPDCWTVCPDRRDFRDRRRHLRTDL